MNQIIKTFITLVLLFSFSIQSFSQTKVKIGTQEETVYPLSVEQKEFAELLPLKRLFDDKEVIGMGEATHGTKEFFDIKAKVFKFLVTNCNYRVFAIEASAGGCAYINDYIQTGNGNIDSVMQRFDMWIWRTEEVKELILWMKDYNLQKSEEEKISFYGFDMQNRYSPVEYICDFLRADTIVPHQELVLAASPILNKSKTIIDGLIIKPASKFRDTLSTFGIGLKNWLAYNKSLIETSYSKKQFERIILCAESYFQSIARIDTSCQFRDSCMAENAVKIQKIDSGKMFLWAHNLHIGMSFVDDSWISIMGPPMGSNIKTKFGEQYYSIGFVFNEGSFQARKGPESISGFLVARLSGKGKFYDIDECVLPVSKKNTLTNTLSLADTDAFFIDLKNSNNSLFSTIQIAYDCEAVFHNYKYSSSKVIAKKQFDGLIYVNKTNRAVPVK